MNENEVIEIDGGVRQYGDYAVMFIPGSLPGASWIWMHRRYDPETNPADRRSGVAGTLLGAIEQIKEIENE